MWFPGQPWRLMPCAYFLVASSLVAAPPETRPVEGLREHVPAVHALTNARIVVSAEKTIERGTVVIRDGVFVAVGAAVDIPADARIWDLDGKTLYPGLLDAFSETPANPPSGSSGYWNSLVTPQVRMGDQYRADTFVNERLRKQGVVGRLVAPAAGVWKGTSVLVTTGTVGGERAIWRADVAQHLRLGVPRSRGREGFPNSPMGAVALARQALLDAQWYGQAWTTYQGNRSVPRPERNDALAALRDHLDQHHLFILDGANELYFLRADRFAREFSLNAVIRGSGQEYQQLEAIRQTGRGVLVPVNFPKPPPVSTPEQVLDAELSELLHWDMAPENPARLEGAGVKIALTSDGLKDVSEFLGGVRTAVSRGLAPAAALRALTVTPAEWFGLADRLGTVEPGKLACLVVTDGDLFEKKTKVLETWIEGVRFEIEKPAPADVRGEWQVKLTDASGASLSYTARITGEPQKLEGKILIPQANQPREVALEKLTLKDGQLSGRVPGKEWNQTGVAQFSAVLLAPPDGAWTLSGRVAWPDGSQALILATRAAASTTTPSDSKPPAKSGEEGAPQDPEPASGVAKKEGEKKTGGGGREGDKPQGGDPSQGGEAKKEEDKPAIDPKASFPVNYPLGAFGRDAAPEQPAVLAIKNATIWTCGPQGVLTEATLLVRAGKIVEVGPAVTIPPDAVVIDAQGKHVAPGIIDCHSHMATDGGVNEGSQAVTAEVRIGDFLDSNDINIYRQLAGGVTAANILHGSANPIGGQNQVIKLRWGTLDEDLRFVEAPPGIKFALGENVKRSNFTGSGSTRYPQSRMGVEQVIRDSFQAAREYQRAWERWAQHHDTLPPRRDLELDALVEILDGKRWVHCHSYRQDEILAFLRTCEEFGVKVATLQHILEGYKVADAMARHGAMGSSFSDWWAYKVEVYDAIPYNGALMHRAGVVVSFNSDDAELARHLNHEAAKSMKYGQIAPEEALCFVTLNAAKQLRIDAHVGSLEPGKHADFVVWSGPPLSLQSRCEQTWIDGRKYFDLADDQQLRQKASAMRATLVQKILASGQTPKSAEENQKPDEELWPREDIYCRTRQSR